MITVVLFIIVVVLYFTIQKLTRRVASLEQELERHFPSVTSDGPVDSLEFSAQPATPEVPPASRDGQHEPDATPHKNSQNKSAWITTATPKSFVFSAERVRGLIGWLQNNWFFLIAAASLALAGIFMVQYGVEHGLLSPERRVLAALALGIVLIAVGEYIRRKLGGDEAGYFALLPSVFSSGGLVSIFAAILSARLLYGLIGAELAFAGLSLVGAIAILLGWFYGPLLAVVGVVGALAAPFLVGAHSEYSYVLYSYFCGIGLVALSVDSIKRWAWLTVIGLAGAYVAALVLFLSEGYTDHAIGFSVIMSLFAVLVPERRKMPTHQGNMILPALLWLGQRSDVRPEYPGFSTRVAWSAYLASTFFICLAFVLRSSYFLEALGGLLIMSSMGVFWLRRAPALTDLAYYPAIASLGIIVLKGLETPYFSVTASTVWLLLGGAVFISLMFAWRSRQNRVLGITDSIVAAAYTPLLITILEVLWQPVDVLGRGHWALLIGLAAMLMLGLAKQFYVEVDKNRLRTAVFLISALSLASFVLLILLDELALSLAWAVMVAVSAWLGRFLKLPLLDRYIQVGVVVVSWRLIVKPGVIWALDAPVWQLLLVFIGVIAIFIAAYKLKRSNAAMGVKVMLESAIWSLSGVLVTLLLIRYFEHTDNHQGYLLVSLVGLIWLILSASQLYRLRAGAELYRIRIVLATIYALAAGSLIALAALELNPLFDSRPVSGPLIFDGLAAAYLLPALLLAFISLRFRHLSMRLRKVFGGLGLALATLYTGLEIRRWWQGDVLSVPGVIDAELYSYTLALMVVAVVLLALAFIRQSATLRKAALVAVALTIMKVYLLDMSGLNGMLRVASFLVLGLVLAAMAWINRLLQNNESILKVADDSYKSEKHE